MLTDEEKALVEDLRTERVMYREELDLIAAIIDRITQEPAILDAAEGILRAKGVETAELGTVSGALVERASVEGAHTYACSSVSLSAAVAKLKGGG